MTFPFELRLLDPGVLVDMASDVDLAWRSLLGLGRKRGVYVYLDLIDGRLGVTHDSLQRLCRARHLVLGAVRWRKSTYVFHGPLWAGFEDELVDVFAARGLKAAVARPRARRPR